MFRTAFAGAVVAAVVAVVGFAVHIAEPATQGSTPVADAGQSPSPTAPVVPIAPVEQAGAPPAQFPSDDRGFIDSSARCNGGQAAYAIGRTPGSLVVICGEQAGRYEYLGVRLSDAAVLRTDAQTGSTQTYLARRAGVVYAVSPTELKVTSGVTVIKREPMIEYREMAR